MKRTMCVLLVSISMVSGVLAMPSAIASETEKDVTARARHQSTFTVLDFGAKGDGESDDTRAFQAALDRAGEDALGGTVFAPRGTYLFKGHLTIPRNVTLEGIWHTPTAWSEYKGTTFLVTDGEGNPDGSPFITLMTNSVIKGVTMFYPNQVVANPPKSYPWAIASGGADNCSIVDVLIVNPYKAVDFGTRAAGRHYIRNLYAQPMLKGLYVDQCYDVGRVENVHFWPFWTCNDPAKKPIEHFIAENGESFIFGRTDWEYVYNTFSWGYKVGYHFIRTEHGVANGNFLGIGADATNNALLVDDCAPYGLLITNGEFVSFLDPSPTSLVVKASNTGVIQLQNCSFWGEADQIANIEGIGTVMFNNCNFSFWGTKDSSLPALECAGQNVVVTSCNFNRPGYHIHLKRGVQSAVVTGNRFAGKPRITNESNGDVQVGLNAAVPLPEPEKGAIIIDDTDTAPAFRTEGEWHEGIGGKDYGTVTHWAYKGTGDSSAYWTPDLPHRGIYAVYVWYGGDPMNNHATNAPFVVKHRDGEETVTINLRTNTGEWHLLGEFSFNKGTDGYVMTSNDANDNVVADAIKFVLEKKHKTFLFF